MARISNSEKDIYHTSNLGGKSPSINLNNKYITTLICSKGHETSLGTLEAPNKDYLITYVKNMKDSLFYTLYKYIKEGDSVECGQPFERVLTKSQPRNTK